MDHPTEHRSTPALEPRQVALAAALTTGLARLLVNARDDYLDAFRACRDKTSATHVHTLRIATRRLRVMISLCDGVHRERLTRKIRKALRRPFRAGGRLRDVQVAIRFLERRLESHPELEAPCDALVSRKRRERQNLRHELQRKHALRLGRAVSKLVALLEDAATNPVRSQRVIESLGERLEAMRADFLAAPLAGTTTADLHPMRVSLKRFRYAVELLEPLIGTNAADLAGELRHLQHGLGEITDRGMLLHKLHEYGRGHRKRGRQLAEFETDLRSERDNRVRIMRAQLRFVHNRQIARSRAVSVLEGEGTGTAVSPQVFRPTV